MLALCVGLSGCTSDQEEATAPEPVRTVRTASVARGDAVQRLELLGELRGVHEVRVFSQLAEPIRTLHVREGDRVKAGQPLATLSTQLPGTGYEQARAAMAAAELEVERLRAELERLQGLLERKAAAQAEVDRLKASLAAAEARVTQQSAALRAADEQRGRSMVRAPIDGVVAQLFVQEGDMANPGAPLARLSRFDEVRVGLQVVEPDFVRLREGMTAQVSPPALPDVRRTGTVVHVGPVLDPRTRTAKAEVLVDNADGALRPGMMAEVRIELSRRPDTVLVPARAVLLDPQPEHEGDAHVFVVKDSTARRREVRLGARYGERLAVQRGLEGGERLVVEGQHLLRDGAKVEVVAADDDNAPLSDRAAGAEPGAMEATP